MLNSRSLTAHRLRSGTVLRAFIGAAFLAASGLSYLHLKNQLYQAGSRKRILESQQRDLILRGQVLDAQIAGLTSRTSLLAMLKEGSIHMVEIPMGSVVHVRLLSEAAANIGLASSGNTEDTVTEASNRVFRPSSSDEGRPGLRTVRQ